MRTPPKFWPLDDGPEDPIYDSLAWDLPGYQKVRSRKVRGGSRQRSGSQRREKKISL
jgi:hypothetical protein